MKCDWCRGNALYEEYHDTEWGVPCFDDQTLFEFVILEGAQAGLSWLTILKRRENYRKAFAGFDPNPQDRFSRCGISGDPDGFFEPVPRAQG